MGFSGMDAGMAGVHVKTRKMVIEFVTLTLVCWGAMKHWVTSKHRWHHGPCLGSHWCDLCICCRICCPCITVSDASMLLSLSGPIGVFLQFSWVPECTLHLIHGDTNTILEPSQFLQVSTGFQSTPSCSLSGFSGPHWTRAVLDFTLTWGPQSSIQQPQLMWYREYVFCEPVIILS